MFLTNEHDFALNNPMVKIVSPLDWQVKEIECLHATRKKWNLLIITLLLGIIKLFINLFQLMPVSLSRFHNILRSSEFSLLSFSLLW